MKKKKRAKPFSEEELESQKEQAKQRLDSKPLLSKGELSETSRAEKTIKKVYKDNLKRLDESELIKLACSGSRPASSMAQNRIYDIYSGRMMALCIRYSKIWEDAEDLLQESFIKVYQNLDKFHHEGSFEGWVRRITVNTCITAYNKYKNVPATLDINACDRDNEVVYDQTSDEDISEYIEVKEILKLVDVLPLGYRMVFNLYAIDGYSHKEIAEMLGITEGTSKTQLCKARKILQMLIQSAAPVLTPGKN